MYVFSFIPFLTDKNRPRRFCFLQLEVLPLGAVTAQCSTRSSVKLECRHCLQLPYDAHPPSRSFSSAFVHFVPFCKQSQNEYLIVSVVNTESLAKLTILVSVRCVVCRDLFSRVCGVCVCVCVVWCGVCVHTHMRAHTQA